MAIAKRSAKKSAVKPAKKVAKSAKKPVTKLKVVKKAAPKAVAKLSSKIVKTFTKSELLSALAIKSGIGKKEAMLFLEGLEEIMHAHLKKGGPEKFVLPGVLKVVVKNVPARKARKGRNPLTGEEMMFKAKPASKKVKISPLKNLKAAV
jgi:nucleoid DNA-binding protein